MKKSTQFKKIVIQIAAEVRGVEPLSVGEPSVVASLACCRCLPSVIAPHLTAGSMKVYVVTLKVKFVVGVCGVEPLSGPNFRVNGRIRVIRYLLP